MLELIEFIVYIKISLYACAPPYRKLSRYMLLHNITVTPLHVTELEQCEDESPPIRYIWL